MGLACTYKRCRGGHMAVNAQGDRVQSMTVAMIDEVAAMTGTTQPAAIIAPRAACGYGNRQTIGRLQSATGFVTGGTGIMDLDIGGIDRCAIGCTGGRGMTVNAVWISLDSCRVIGGKLACACGVTLHTVGSCGVATFGVVVDSASGQPQLGDMTIETRRCISGTDSATINTVCRIAIYTCAATSRVNMAHAAGTVDLNNNTGYRVIRVMTCCAVTIPSKAGVIMTTAFKSVLMLMACRTITAYSCGVRVRTGGHGTIIGETGSSRMTNLTDACGIGTGLDKAAIGLKEFDRLGAYAVPD